jgi:serine/threonine-protein kinase
MGAVEFRERFAAEAKTIARLRHPYIVEVYDFSVSMVPSGELLPWMALEWLSGETMAMHLERRHRSGECGRDPLAAIEFLRPVMLALAHAHQHGIAHRDIKPSNIMVTETDRGPSLRVLDFGIAKIMMDDKLPNTGNTRTESSPVFSPAYAAPEQVAFSRTGPWTDVHALGLLLTEVMTDVPPFSDADPDAHLFEQVMSRRRPTPASKGRDVGPYESIIAKALSLSPRDRWKGAGELLAALDDVTAGGTSVRIPEVSTESALASGAARTAGVRWRARALAAATVILMTLVVWWTSRRGANLSGAAPSPSLPENVTAKAEGASALAAQQQEPALPPEPQPSLPALPVATVERSIKAVPRPPTYQRKEKKKEVLALPPPGLDGRELFDDTK